MVSAYSHFNHHLVGQQPYLHDMHVACAQHLCSCSCLYAVGSGEEENRSCKKVISVTLVNRYGTCTVGASGET